MRAVCFEGKENVQVETVPDPVILNPRDAIVRVTATAICGSDLHIYDGYIPTMQKGDMLGHEFMGEVVEVGHGERPPSSRRPRRRAVHDRVRPVFLLQGTALVALRQLESRTRGWPRSCTAIRRRALFGYSHMYGGYAGGQAEYVRVPFADVGPLKVPDSLSDEQVLFLSDIFPTGYMAAENCDIKRGDTVAVWGCGPVGQFAIKSAFLLGAERVIAIDRFPERLELAAADGRAETLNYSQDATSSTRSGRIDGRSGTGRVHRRGRPRGAWHDARRLVRPSEDARCSWRPIGSHALRQAISACRKGGTVSIPGVYGGLLDKFPLGAAFAKGLTLKMGQTHMHKYMPKLLSRIERGDIDPSFIITHRMWPRRRAARCTGRSGTSRSRASRSSSSPAPPSRATPDAEKQLTKALPKLAKAAMNPKLRQAFESHLEETRTQIERLEQVFESIEEKVQAKHCDGLA